MSIFDGFSLFYYLLQYHVKALHSIILLFSQNSVFIGLSSGVRILYTQALSFYANFHEQAVLPFLHCISWADSQFCSLANYNHLLHFLDFLGITTITGRPDWVVSTNLSTMMNKRVDYLILAYEIWLSFVGYIIQNGKCCPRCSKLCIFTQTNVITMTTILVFVFLTVLNRLIGG